MPHLNLTDLKEIEPVPGFKGRFAHSDHVTMAYWNIAARGGNLIWCHGRTSALPFYRALGFREHGDEFEVPVTEPHYVLQREVKPDEK